MKYIKSFDSSVAMKAYAAEAEGNKNYVFRDDGGSKGIGRGVSSGKRIVLYKHHVPTTDYLMFTARQGGSTIKLNNGTFASASYSLDGGTTWENALGVTVTLANTGDSVIYKGKTNGSTGIKFVMTGQIDASGTVMSMYNEDPTDTEITIEHAFQDMFQGCTALFTAPELTAKVLVSDCYAWMFYGCSNISSITCYATNWLSMSQWLYRTWDKGTFYNYGEATIPISTSDCPSGWTMINN